MLETLTERNTHYHDCIKRIQATTQSNAVGLFLFDDTMPTDGVLISQHGAQTEIIAIAPHLIDKLIPVRIVYNLLISEFQMEGEVTPELQLLADTAHVEQGRSVFFAIRPEPEKLSAVLVLMNPHLCVDAENPNFEFLTTFGRLYSKIISNEYQPETIARRGLSEREHILLKETNRLHASNRELLHSYRAASRVQRSLLGQAAELGKHFAHSHMTYLPKDILSGDFFWWHQKGNKVVFAFGDCTGHGAQGAMLSLVGMNLLSHILADVQETDPAQLLSLLNFRLICVLQPDMAVERITDGMDLAIMVYDPATQKAEIASANMTYFVVQNGQVTRQKGNPFPIAGSTLGTTDDPFARDYQKDSYDLKADDKLLFYTDGVTDQYMRVNEGMTKKFGSRQLEQLVTDNCSLSAAQIGQMVEDRMKDCLRNCEQLDDISLLALQV